MDYSEVNTGSGETGSCAGGQTGCGCSILVEYGGKWWKMVARHHSWLLALQRDPAEPGEQPGELEEAGGALRHRQVCPPDLLDELQLEELSHGGGLAHAEHVGDDVLGAVAEAPQVRQDPVRRVNVRLHAEKEIFSEKQNKSVSVVLGTPTCARASP